MEFITQTPEWKEQNRKVLEEVNNSLRPDPGAKTGKVGIFVDGQNGDMMTVMSCLKYRDQLFPGKEIIWYSNMPNGDNLKYAPISEVRPYPWAGNGLPAGYENFYPNLCDFSNNRLNEKYKDFELTADLTEGHFPATWSCINKGTLDYPSISRRHFGFDQSVPWHPYLSFSAEEKEVARDYMSKLPRGRKNVMIETFGGSGQTHWDHKNTLAVKVICREIWGDCNFIFTCPKYLRTSYPFPPELFDDEGVVNCSHFTIRQTALLVDYADLFIGVSSGVSVASSAWGLKPTPKFQFCGSFKCSTVTLATGPIELVDHGDYDQDRDFSRLPLTMIPTQRQRFESTLRSTLIKYK